MAKVHDNVLEFRSVPVNSSTLDTETRSIGAVAATEQPVPMIDWKRMEMVPEVLRMDGVILPSTGQVPLLDSHQRHTNDNLLGSFTNPSINGSELNGRATFSTAKSAEDSYTKVREGHLRDLSAGYRVLEKTYVPKGKTQEVKGRSYTGPVNVVTKWRLHEVSVTPIGADDQAKMRGYTSFPLANSKEVFVMNEELRALCVKAGMPADSSDEQAQTWLVQNFDKVGSRKIEPATVTTLEEGEKLSPRKDEDIERLVKKHFEDQEAARKAHQEDLLNLSKLACEKRGLPEEVAIAIANRCKTREEVHEAVGDEYQKRTVSVNPRFISGPSQIDKHVGAVKDGLMTRLLPAGHPDIAPEKRAAGWDQFQHRTLMQIATELVTIEGWDISSATQRQVIECAYGFGEKSHLQRRTSYGYHSSGMFTKLMADAVNKNLLTGYTEYPSTWRQVFRQGKSVADFKSIKKIRVSAFGNIDVWPANKPPHELTLTDEQEAYSLDPYSNSVSFDYISLINDDLGGLTDVPMQLGAAINRTINAVAWAQITSNPLMQDGVALFSTATGARKKANYVAQGSGSAPTVLTVSAGKKLMRLQVGTNNRDGSAATNVLNITPRFLVVPANLENTALQLTTSLADPASSNSGVANTVRSLETVVEPLLDSNVDTSWYLFADPRFWNNVEVTFLQGQESPEVRTETDFETLAQKTIILQSFAAKAIEWRTMFKNYGA